MYVYVHVYVYIFICSSAVYCRLLMLPSRMPQLERDLQTSRMELSRRTSELERAKDELNISRQNTVPAVSGSRDTADSERSVTSSVGGGPGNKSGAAGDIPVPGPGLDADMCIMLKEALAYSNDEIEILKTRLRDVSDSKRKTVRGAGDGVDGDATGIGVKGEGEGMFGKTAGGTLTLDEWRKVVSSGLDTNAFGQFGIKRPVFSVVRSTFFKPSA
jgi:hypothetical protein